MAGTFFWNRIARRYARMPVRDEQSYREKLARTRALFSPDWQVLEIGCGTGSTALEHAPHVRHIRAIDFAPKMIEICREKAEAAGIDNISFEVADAAALDVAPESHDAVLAMSLLHLVDNPATLIRDIHAMLRPGGIFVSSSTCLGGQKGLALDVILPLGGALGLLPKLKRFTVDELIAMIEAAGFAVEETWQPGEDPMKAVFLVARKPG